MKLIIAFAFALVAVAIAAPVEKEQVQIVRSNIVQNPDGTYNYSYELDDGTTREETGELREVIGEDKKPVFVLVVRGAYTYKNEDGSPIKVEYTSDEFGFKAFGDHIPKPEGVSRR